MIHETCENGKIYGKQNNISGKSLNMIYFPKEEKVREQEKRYWIHFFCIKKDARSVFECIIIILLNVNSVTPHSAKNCTEGAMASWPHNKLKFDLDIVLLSVLSRFI